MPFVLFLSRGHGFGHAARDLRVIQAIRAARPDVDIVLAASGTAVDYFTMHRVRCVDLGIADRDDMTRSAADKVLAFLRRLPRPDLVISDEVIWPLRYCAEVWRVPCVLLTDWFFAEYGMPDRDPYLDLATEIVVLDFRVAHPGPFAVSAPIRYAGPVVRAFPAVRAKVRAELGMADSALLAVVTLGGMPGRDETVRMADLVTRCWRERAGAADRMHVLADPPPASSDPAGSAAGIIWRGIVAEPEDLYAAADVVVTDAMGTTSCDLAHNRVPVLGMVDRRAGYPTSFHLRVREMAAAGLMVAADTETDTGADALWSALERAVATTGPAAGEQAAARFEWASEAEVAAGLLGHLDADSGPEPATAPSDVPGVPGTA
jgi:hypothetical protein